MTTQSKFKTFMGLALTLATTGVLLVVTIDDSHASPPPLASKTTKVLPPALSVDVLRGIDV